MRHLMLLSVFTIACGGTSTIDSNDAATSVDDARADAMPDNAILDVATPDAPKAGDDGGTVPQDAGSGCNALVNGAQVIQPMESSAKAPDALGGAIAPGLYFLTASTIYDGKTGAYGPTLQVTMKFDPTTVEVVGGATNRADDTWTTNGVALEWVSTCPVKGYKTDFAYTATANELRLYYDGIGSTTELVLAKQ